MFVLCGLVVGLVLIKSTLRMDDTFQIDDEKRMTMTRYIMLSLINTNGLITEMAVFE